jgi:hypothetical protein
VSDGRKDQFAGDVGARAVIDESCPTRGAFRSGCGEKLKESRGQISLGSDHCVLSRHTTMAATALWLVALALSSRACAFWHTSPISTTTILSSCHYIYEMIEALFNCLLRYSLI